MTHESEITYFHCGPMAEITVSRNNKRLQQIAFRTSIIKN